MATGDTQDIVNRLVAVLPPWFPTPIANAPILRGLLTGIATPLSWLYSVIAYARTQTRLKTMSGGFLDLASLDFLGPTFSRRVAETDSSFQSRLLAFLLLPKNTVAGITAMLKALTGNSPALLEPAIGTGGYDATPAFAWDDTGCWSGDALAITAFRPPGQGIPNVDGFDGGYGGFDAGAIEWSDISQTTGAVTDAEITMRVRQWVAAGVKYTLDITNVPQDAPAWVTRANGILPAVDINFAANAAWVKGVGVVSIPSLLNVVRSTPETVTDAAGNITYAVPNAPAYSSAGLQSWEARTNLVTQSQNIAAWTSFNSTVTSNAAIAPDGTTTAGTLQATSSSQAGAVSANTFSVSAGLPYTFSKYIAVASGSPWALLQLTNGTLSADLWVNASTGAIGTQFASAGVTILSVLSIPVAQGFFRVSITASFASSTTGEAVIICANGNGSGASTNGQSIKVWGAQVEQEAVASPYIPTTTAAVARANDYVTLSSLLNFGNSITILAGGANYSPTGILAAAVLAAISDGSFNNRIELYTSAGLLHDILIESGGSTSVNSGIGGAITQGVPTIWAISLTPGSANTAYDGNAGSSFSSVVSPLGLNTIVIGGVQAANGAQWNGNINRLTIWPTSFFPTATLQAIT